VSSKRRGPSPVPRVFPVYSVRSPHSQVDLLKRCGRRTTCSCRPGHMRASHVGRDSRLAVEQGVAGQVQLPWIYLD